MGYLNSGGGCKENSQPELSVSLHSHVRTLLNSNYKTGLDCIIDNLLYHTSFLRMKNGLVAAMHVHISATQVFMKDVYLLYASYVCGGGGGGGVGQSNMDPWGVVFTLSTFFVLQMYYLSEGFKTGL